MHCFVRTTIKISNIIKQNKINSVLQCFHLLYIKIFERNRGTTYFYSMVIGNPAEKTKMTERDSDNWRLASSGFLFCHTSGVMAGMIQILGLAKAVHRRTHLSDLGCCSAWQLQGYNLHYGSHFLVFQGAGRKLHGWRSFRNHTALFLMFPLVWCNHRIAQIKGWNINLTFLWSIIMNSLQLTSSSAKRIWIGLKSTVIWEIIVCTCMKITSNIHNFKVINIFTL